MNFEIFTYFSKEDFHDQSLASISNRWDSVTSGCFSCRHNTSRFHPGTLTRLMTPHKIQAITSEGTYSGHKFIRKKIILKTFNTKIPNLLENLCAVIFPLLSPSYNRVGAPREDLLGEILFFFERKFAAGYQYVQEWF